MKSQTKHIILCDCEGTMSLDGNAITKACKGAGTASVSEIHTSLCRKQADRLAALFSDTSPQDELFIACTQETSLFESLADEAGRPAPHTLNIREQAGWSDEGQKATAKIAALIAAAVSPPRPARSMAMTSHGRCLIYGGGAAGIALGQALQGVLGVTVMLTPTDSLPLADQHCGQLARGQITKASGHFTAFQLTIDGFAEALPSSRSELSFPQPSDAVETSCDILIDLSGGTPLFTGHEKRDGYFRCAADDTAGLAQIRAAAAEMIGSFEKPIYVDFDENLCAHSRNGLTGCTRCLDVCPAGAITTAGDHVAIDAGICGGCGLCGAVCPSGAARTAYPSAESQLQQLSVLAETYSGAGGKNPALLLHDASFGSEMIAMIARHGRGLPAHVIPFEMHSTGRCGHDLLVGAVALGFHQIFILANPALREEQENSLSYQISLVGHLCAGVAVSAENRFVLIQELDPEQAEARLWDTPAPAACKSAAFYPAGNPRTLTRLGLRGLAKAAGSQTTAIALPSGAPYGRVDVNTDSCTLCLSCVGACPAGALQDNPDAPQLLFREDACLQCGICVATCPEKVIALVPQFNLADSAMATDLLLEDTPFHCTGCGKAFGTTRSVENIIARLSEHSMFRDEGRTEMLRMCEDCRVEVMFAQDTKLEDVKERPRPRTTDDYLN